MLYINVILLKSEEHVTISHFPGFRYLFAGMNMIYDKLKTFCHNAARKCRLRY